VLSSPRSEIAGEPRTQGSRLAKRARRGRRGGHNPARLTLRAAPERPPRSTAGQGRSGVRASEASEGDPLRAKRPLRREHRRLASEAARGQRADIIAVPTSAKLNSELWEHASQISTEAIRASQARYQDEEQTQKNPRQKYSEPVPFCPEQSRYRSRPKRLARSYILGKGVQQDQEQGWYWVKSAACLGVDAANKLVHKVESSERQRSAGVPSNPAKTLADDLQSYKACLLEHSDDTSKCDALEKIYKADLEVMKLLLGSSR